jgi:hypothetical protein
MKKILILLVTFGFVSTLSAQHVFEQPVVIKNLKKHVYFLADDKLEGRRTGTVGEKKAANYISKNFKKLKLKPAGTSGYLQPFSVYDGRKIASGSSVVLDGKALKAMDDYFPLALSGNGKFQSVMFLDIAPSVQKLKDNPHHNINDDIRQVANKAVEQNKALVVYNSGKENDELVWDPKSKADKVAVPVIYLNKKNNISFQNIEKSNINIQLELTEEYRTGYNVVGYIDNGAPTTVVIGAHYDHLGYGEDKNSMYTGSTPMIHNGADDNASGTSSMMELARLISKSNLKNNNYIFIAFSGEELGLYGSRYFAENYADINKVNYMINLDMVGRAVDSARKLTVGGFGTSPVWSEIIKQENCLFELKIDSSGSGPSDHTSFYKKDIPVLFFFTGTHSDYHKPSDDADKINYFSTSEIVRYVFNIVEKVNNKGKLPFTKTREASVGRTSFKVTMGILIDYTYSGQGVYVDGVTENRPGFKAGILKGDVIHKIGEHDVTDVTTYMQALNKFNKGETTTIELTRGEETLKLSLTF